MKADQFVRIACGAFVTLAYGARLATVGNGPVVFLGYEGNPFALTLVILLLLAVPETLDRLPVGPSKN